VTHTNWFRRQGSRISALVSTWPRRRGEGRPGPWRRSASDVAGSQREHEPGGGNHGEEQGGSRERPVAATVRLVTAGTEQAGGLVRRETQTYPAEAREHGPVGFVKRGTARLDEVEKGPRIR
jgi:hypothetical protein